MARQKLELESERAVPKSREVKFWHKLLLWLSAGILLSSVGWHCWERLLHHYKLGVKRLAAFTVFYNCVHFGWFGFLPIFHTTNVALLSVSRTQWRWCSNACGKTVGRYWAQLQGFRNTYGPSTLGKNTVSKGFPMEGEQSSLARELKWLLLGFSFSDPWVSEEMVE